MTEQLWIAPRLNLVKWLDKNPNLRQPQQNTTTITKQQYQFQPTYTQTVKVEQSYSFPKRENAGSPLAAGPRFNAGPQLATGPQFYAGPALEAGTNNNRLETYQKMEYQKNNIYKFDGRIIVIDNSTRRQVREFAGNFAQNAQQAQNQGIYVDYDFPASYNNLVSHKSWEKASKVKNYVWKRPKEIYQDGYVLWDTIEPNDVSQGPLGNCYFLAAISAIAEFLERIKRIFINKEANQLGIYGLRICECGEFREIIIDDQIPYNPATRSPAFCYSKSNEIWVILLEKAWAKLNETYEQTEGGQAAEVLHDFTGAPVMQVRIEEKTPEEVWKIMSEANIKNYVMRCSGGGYKTPQAQIKEGKTREGLITGHEYSLIDVCQTRSGQRLCKVRNPWGKFEWNGAWSDKYSRNWTPQLRQEVGFTDADDGTFFMSFDDFRNNFNRVEICFVHDNYIYTYFKVQQENQSAVTYKLSILKHGHYFISINQPNVREWDSAQKKLQQPCLGLIVGKDLGNGRFQSVGVKTGCEKEVWIECKLTSGDYIVYTYVISNVTREDKDISVSVYGEAKAIFTLLNANTSQLSSMISQVFAGIGKSNKQLQPYNEEPQCLKSSGFEGFFGYFYIQNNSNSWLESSLELKIEKKALLFNIFLHLNLDPIKYILDPIKNKPSGAVSVSVNINTDADAGIGNKGKPQPNRNKYEEDDDDEEAEEDDDDEEEEEAEDDDDDEDEDDEDEDDDDE